MSKSAKGCLFAAIAGYLVLAAVLVTLKMVEKLDLHSSPKLSRDTPGFKSGSLGLLKEASRRTDQVRPATEAMGVPKRHEGIDGSFLLEWPEEKILPSGNPPDPWVPDLQGDDELEFVAFATWIPQPDDPLPDDNPSHFPLRFYDAKIQEPLSVERLDTLGVPEEMRSLEPPRTYNTPRISLLFRCRNMEHVRFNEINIGDARTGARVGYDLESLGELDSRSQSIGEWSRVDAALLIWHDSPLTCRLRVLTGEPQLARLPQKPGEQVVFGDALRLQWISTVPRDISVSNYIDRFVAAPSVPDKKAKNLLKRYDNQSFGETRALLVTLEEKDAEETNPRTLLRASSETYVENHIAVLRSDGPDWSWSEEEEEGNLLIESVADTSPLDQPIELLFLPHTTELVFEIPHLPEAPNSRDAEDLFDITLPRITLDKDISDAERQLIGYISVSTQLKWESTRKWGDNPPTNLPNDHTFRNQTPQQLLDWYLKNTKGAFVRYDEEDLVLYINESRETWWSNLLEKWPNFLP